MSASRTITDLTRGMYRRLYAGYLYGKRINAVSLDAEAWFWRVTAAADDFGNLRGSKIAFYDATKGLRFDSISADDTWGWRSELVAAKLLREYVVADEVYIHVCSWMTLQPGPRNGKRVRLFPASPYEDLGKPDASRCYQDQNQDQNQDHRSTGGSPEPQAASVPPPLQPAAILVFPTVGNPNTWGFTQHLLDELTSDYQDAGMDVMLEVRKAYSWVKANGARRKTARGMRAFLINWLNKATSFGGRNTSQVSRESKTDDGLHPDDALMLARKHGGK